MLCGIVLYHPILSRLKENLERLLKANKPIVCFNNGCDVACMEYLKNLHKRNVYVIGNGNNQGIAFALNRIMAFAEEGGFEWVVTLDQDSIVDDLYFYEIDMRLNNLKDNIAIVCPKIVDNRRIYPANKIVAEMNDDHYVKMCITSGGCTRVAAWKSINGFDDYLFIDLVDNDFCKRLDIAGWKMLRMFNVELNQEFGNITPRNEKITNIIKKICCAIHNQKLAVNISKLAYKKTVSPMRIYYSNRNILYLNKKLKNYGGIGYESYNCNSYIGYALFYNVASILRGQKKIVILKAVLKGIWDGARCKVEPIVINKI